DLHPEIIGAREYEAPADVALQRRESSSFGDTCTFTPSLKNDILEYTEIRFVRRPSRGHLHVCPSIADVVDDVFIDNDTNIPLLDCVLSVRVRRLSRWLWKPHSKASLNTRKFRPTVLLARKAGHEHGSLS